MGKFGKKGKKKSNDYHPYRPPSLPDTKPQTEKDFCSNCKISFKSLMRNKGYNRLSLSLNLATGQPARELLDQLTGVKTSPEDIVGRFLCRGCWTGLTNISRYNSYLQDFFGATQPLSYVDKKKREGYSTSGERSPGPDIETEIPQWTEDHSYNKDPIPPKPPKQRPPKQPKLTHKSVGVQTLKKYPGDGSKNLFGRQSSRSSKKSFGRRSSRKNMTNNQLALDITIGYIHSRKYRGAISSLYRVSPATKRHFHVIAARIVRKETRLLLEKHRDIALLSNDLSVSAIKDFSWDASLEHIAEHAPLLFSVIRGAVTTKNNEKTMNRGPRVNLKPIIGTALAILFHSMAPQAIRFLQSFVSLHFYRGKLKRETVTQLSHLGLCLGYETGIKMTDNIPSSANIAALRLKSSVEKEQESTLPASPENFEDAEGNDIFPKNCDGTQDGDQNQENFEDTVHDEIKQDNFEDAEDDDLSSENCDDDIKPDNIEEAEGDDLSPENSDDDAEDDDLSSENCEDAQDDDLNSENPEDTLDDDIKQDNFEDGEDDDLSSENCEGAQDGDQNSEIPEDTLDDDIKQENLEDAEGVDLSPENCDDAQDGDRKPENFEDAEEGTLNLECFEMDEDVDSEVTEKAEEDLNSEIEIIKEDLNLEMEEDDDLNSENSGNEDLNSENSGNEDLNSEITVGSGYKIKKP